MVQLCRNILELTLLKKNYSAFNLLKNITFSLQLEGKVGKYLKP